MKREVRGVSLALLCVCAFGCATAKPPNQATDGDHGPRQSAAQCRGVIGDVLNIPNVKVLVIGEARVSKFADIIWNKQQELFVDMTWPDDVLRTPVFVYGKLVSVHIDAAPPGHQGFSDDAAVPFIVPEVWGPLPPNSFSPKVK